MIATDLKNIVGSLSLLYQLCTSLDKIRQHAWYILELLCVSQRSMVEIKMPYSIKVAAFLYSLSVLQRYSTESFYNNKFAQ